MQLRASILFGPLNNERMQMFTALFKAIVYPLSFAAGAAMVSMVVWIFGGMAGYWPMARMATLFEALEEFGIVL